MKKALSLIGSVLALLLATGWQARAQLSPELQAVQDAAGERSILFRGKESARYSFPANGHPYWIHPDFERGDITFEGNFYHDVLINIDAVAQRALVHLEGRPFAVALAPALTPSFTMGGRQFVGFGPGEALGEGFYEVFGAGPERVYKHVFKYVNSSVYNVNGETIGYYDENYRADVARHFVYRKSYWLRDAQGHFTRIKSRGALLRHFPDRKKEIRQALRAEGLTGGSSDFDAFCKTVLNLVSR